MSPATTQVVFTAARNILTKGVTAPGVCFPGAGNLREAVPCFPGEAPLDKASTA